MRVRTKGGALDGWSFRFEKHSAFVQMCFIVLGLSDESDRSFQIWNNMSISHKEGVFLQDK